jgi:hypothetical protein
MADEGARELYLTGFEVKASVGGLGLGANPGPVMPMVGLDIDGRPDPEAADESIHFQLQVEAARALAAELVAEADRAKQLARQQGGASQN